MQLFMCTLGGKFDFSMKSLHSLKPQCNFKNDELNCRVSAVCMVKSSKQQLPNLYSPIFANPSMCRIIYERLSVLPLHFMEQLESMW